MIEKETYRLDSKTPVGSAMIQQAASALYFILGVAIFLVRYPVQDIIIITIAASLYGVAFVQILLIRYVLQKEPNGIQASRVVAYFAFILNCLLELFIILSAFDYKSLFFLFPAVLNFMLVKRLGDIKDEKTID